MGNEATTLIEHRIRGDTLELTIFGRLASGASSYVSLLVDDLLPHVCDVHLNTSHLTSMDRDGIELLLSIAGRLRRGGRMTIGGNLPNANDASRRRSKRTRSAARLRAKAGSKPERT